MTDINFCPSLRLRTTKYATKDEMAPKESSKMTRSCPLSKTARPVLVTRFLFYFYSIMSL